MTNELGFDLSQKFSKARGQAFAEYLIGMQKQAGFKMSARGLCYLLEGRNIITKDQFDKG